MSLARHCNLVSSSIGAVGGRNFLENSWVSGCSSGISREKSMGVSVELQRRRALPEDFSTI